MTKEPERRVYVVRPYDSRIRDRIFPALSRLDLTIRPDDVIPPKTPDADVLRWLRARPAPEALLVPFHAHRDVDGELVHGLEVIRQIREELPGFARIPIFAPISNLGLAAANLMLARYEGQMDQVLFLYVDDLSDAELARAIRAHWSEYGSA